MVWWRLGSDALERKRAQSGVVGVVAKAVTGGWKSGREAISGGYKSVGGSRLAGLTVTPEGGGGAPCSTPPPFQAQP